MEEKKPVPAQGVWIALAVLFFVFALILMVGFLGTAVALTGSTYPQALVPEGALTLVFSALETALFIFFGVRILTGLATSGKSAKEAMVFGLSFSACLLLSQIGFYAVDSLIAANNPNLTFTTDVFRLVAYTLLNLVLFVLFLLALIFFKNKSVVALNLSLIGSGMFALRYLLAFVLEISASKPQALAIFIDLLPIAFSLLLIIAFALTLSSEKRQGAPAPAAALPPEAGALSKENPGDSLRTK